VHQFGPTDGATLDDVVLDISPQTGKPGSQRAMNLTPMPGEGLLVYVGQILDQSASQNHSGWNPTIEAGAEPHLLFANRKSVCQMK
jgi:hypothetical protein